MTLKDNVSKPFTYSSGQDLYGDRDHRVCCYDNLLRSRLTLVIGTVPPSDLGTSRVFSYGIRRDALYTAASSVRWNTRPLSAVWTVWNGNWELGHRCR